jgi:Domain of Unknown Function (DUF1080)
MSFTRMMSAVLMTGALVSSCSFRCQAEEPDGEWLQLFNGRDLTGWTPKIRGHAAGENYADTFRVDDGVLKVAYDKYNGEFNDRFGHLFYEKPFSNYLLRIEYRFVGEQAPGGPTWAVRNSGVMLHGQTPDSMPKDQDFPVSIEAQFLGGDGRNPRTTANLCTPGTHVVMDGKLFSPHCTNSTSKTYHGDQWVTVEFEVHRGKLIRHQIDGRTVIEYSEPQLDDRDASARRLLDAGAAKMLTVGTISLQSESHPIEFRKVELRELNE